MIYINHLPIYIYIFLFQKTQWPKSNIISKTYTSTVNVSPFMLNKSQTNPQKIDEKKKPLPRNVLWNWSDNTSKFFFIKSCNA